MIIIGELINASRKVVKKAIEEGDAITIQEIALAQAKAGADYIDVNAGIFAEDEPKFLQWLVEMVQEVTDVPCAIDSPSAVALDRAIKVHRGLPMINSISLEAERYEDILPLVSGSDTKIIALCMSDDGMPQTTDERMKIADKLVESLTRNNIPLTNIFVDPLVQPLSVNKDFGVEFLDAVQKIMESFDGIHTACGLSNISYGLPERKMLNQTFMVMAITKGLDGAIINPLDKKMMANIIAAESLAGRDNFCMNYLKSYRAGVFE